MKRITAMVQDIITKELERLHTERHTLIAFKSDTSVNAGEIISLNKLSMKVRILEKSLRKRKVALSGK